MLTSNNERSRQRTYRTIRHANLMRLLLSVSCTVFLFCIAQASRAQLPTSAPSIGVKSVAVDSIALGYVDLSITLNAVNDNSQDIVIDSYRYLVEVNEKQLLDRSVPGTFTLPANKTSDVVIPVRLPFNEVLSSGGFQLLTQGTLRYKITGFVKIADFPMQIPFEKSGALDISDKIERLAPSQQ